MTSGGVHLAEGHYGAAERSARAALRLAPHSIEGLVLLGVTFASRGRLVEALEVYQQALSESPDDYVAQYHVAQTLMLLPPSAADADADGRAALARRMLASVPARLHPRLLLEAASDLLEQGRGREARAALTEAEGLLDPADPRHAPRRMSLIRLRAQMVGFGGDADGAVRIMLDALPEAERVLTQSSELDAFRTSLGLHHLLAGDASEALRVLHSTLDGARRSRRLGPLTQTLRHTASAHEDLGDAALARRLRREAVRVAACGGRDDHRCLVAELDLAEDEAEERDPRRVLRTADRLGERLRELGHARVATRCDELAAGALIRLGDHAGARDRLLDAVVVRRRCGEPATAPTLVRLALVAGRSRRPAVAARLLRLAERRTRRARHRQLVIDVATELRTQVGPGAVAHR